MCACSDYSALDKSLPYATTMIWHYFISFSISGIDPAAEILLRDPAATEPVLTR